MGISFEEFAGQPAADPEVVADPATTPAPKPEAQPAVGVSFEDFAEGRTPAKQMLEDLGIDKRAPRGYVEKGLNAMKSAGGNTAVLADMVLSAPWFAMSIGANWGNKLTGMALGQDWKTAAQSGRRVQEEMMSDFGNPLHQLMKIIDNGFGTHTAGGYSDNTVAELFGKVSSLIDQAGEWVEKKSDGKIPSEEVANMADGLMLLTGAKGGDMVKRLWDMRKNAPKDYVPPEVSSEQTQKQGPRATAQQDINEMLNIRSTRDRRAYDAKRRREVREAFNNDPDYADYLKFHADERVSNHDNWNKSAREQEVREQRARESTESPLDGVEIRGDSPEFTAWNKRAKELQERMNEHRQRAQDLTGEEQTKAFDEADKVLEELKKHEAAGWKGIPKPVEATPSRIQEILAKPGFERTAQDLIDLRQYNRKQGGYIRPELAARMAAFGIGATAGLMLDPEDPIQASLLGGAALMAPTLLMGGPGKVSSKFGQSGAVKGPGGMWHPEAVDRLSGPLKSALGRGEERLRELGRGGGQEALDRHTAEFKSDPGVLWADKAIRNYLNKYAGTERDPLSKIELPSGKTWEQVIDAVIKGTKAPGPKGEEIQWDIPERDITETGMVRANVAADAFHELQGQLSHVGDYLRQNVPAEKLGQYDLVRAVRETAANDARVAKEMKKAQAASTKDLPVHKEYPDGMKWVELKLPEKLTLEQAKTIKRTGKDAGSPDEPSFGEYTAMDAQGKPIKNSYTMEDARGRTPEEAWLAGRLAEEGNQMGHCVGGYCASVASGDTRIYSLRDPKGGSHVTVEVQPKNPEKVNHEGSPPEDGELTQAHMRNSDDITQIKGKQNRAPNPEYLPYVQDFVKSGKWGEVGDIENTGLWRGSKGEYLSEADLLKRTDALHKESGGRLPKVSVDDLLDYRQRQYGPSGGEQVPAHRTISEALRLGEASNWQHNARGRQAGSVDIKTAAKIAGLAGGAVVGASMADNKVVGSILGALGGLVIGGASPRGVANVVKKAWAPDTRIRINKLANSWEYKTEASARAVFQLQTRMEQLIPKESDRIAISHAVESGTVSQLSPRMQEGARISQQFFARMADIGQEAGVLKDAVANYITHLWKNTEASGGIVDEIFGRKGGFSMSPETKFALRRSVPTIAEGKAKGLIPITEDISAIMGIYGNALNRAMANRELITALKNEKVPGTEQGLVLKDRDAPATYQKIDHPQLAGMRVHPDIVPSMKFIFDNHSPGVVMRGLEGINMLSKRMAVSFSLFHAKALADAFIGAASNPLRTVKQIGQAAAPKLFGTNEYLQQLRNGGAGDLVDTAQRAGLKFSMGKDSLGVEDVRGSFYTAMKDLQSGLDGVVKGAGMPVAGFIKANHAMDRFMWDRLHAGMKLSTFAEKYTTLLENNAKAHERNPQVPLRPKEQLAEMAASFTNDVFGGLNWRRIAESATTRWGREATLNILSPAGRRVSQLLLFAPDWTLSTARAAYKGFGIDLSNYSKARDAGAGRLAALSEISTGSGALGVFKPKNETDLHRQYLARSAIYYLVVGDAINLAMSGHHWWENKDPTTIDMGDGRTMQWSKHTMESVHWLTKPRQQGLNKLGFIPREIANQSLGTEYLSAYGKSPPMKDRLGHLARGFSPISVQQNFEAGSGAGIAGFLGTPIYGKTYAERQMLKEQRRMSRRLDYKPREPK